MHMRIPKGCPNRFVTEQLLHNLKIAPEPAQLCSRGMAQIVKASAHQSRGLNRLTEIRSHPSKTSKRFPLWTKNIWAVNITRNGPQNFGQGPTHRKQQRRLSLPLHDPKDSLL